MENIEARFSPRKTSSRRNCCVPQCTSKYYLNPDLRFHGFPKEGEVVLFTNKLNVREKCDRRKMWIRLLKIGRPVTKNMSVCSRHFLKSDYFLPDSAVKHRFLKKTAVPSLNLPIFFVKAEISAEPNFDNWQRPRMENEIPVDNGQPALIEEPQAVVDDRVLIAADALMTLWSSVSTVIESHCGPYS